MFSVKWEFGSAQRQKQRTKLLLLTSIQKIHFPDGSRKFPVFSCRRRFLRPAKYRRLCGVLLQTWGREGQNLRSFPDKLPIIRECSERVARPRLRLPYSLRISLLWPNFPDESRNSVENLPYIEEIKCFDPAHGGRYWSTLLRDSGPLPTRA